MLGWDVVGPQATTPLQDRCHSCGTSDRRYYWHSGLYIYIYIMNVYIYIYIYICSLQILPKINGELTGVFFPPEISGVKISPYLQLVGNAHLASCAKVHYDPSLRAIPKIRLPATKNKGFSRDSILKNIHLNNII